MVERVWWDKLAEDCTVWVLSVPDRIMMAHKRFLENSVNADIANINETVRDPEERARLTEWVIRRAKGPTWV